MKELFKRKFPYFQFNDDGNERKFTDLNPDCIFLILERLDFPELLNAAQVNSKFSTVAADVFRVKLSHLQILYRDDIYFPVEPSDPSTQILLNDNSIIVKTFKHFGHVMKKLRILSSREYKRVKFLGNLISGYTSDSLVDISFVDSDDVLLKHITKPLVKVESVSFTRVHLNVVPDELSLNELFPSVRRMELVSLTGSGLSHYFDCHLTHLEHVHIEHTATDEINLPMNIIINNPQIRSVDIEKDNPELVQQLNTFLPQLETLTLAHFQLSNGNIRFENVTTFAIKLGDGSPANLHFPRLEKLYIDYKSERIEDWMQFLNEHNHLKNLHLEFRIMSDLDFQQLTANLTDLVEVTIEDVRKDVYRRTLGTTAIMEFLKNHEKVKRFNVINLYDNERDELQGQLISGWDVKMVDRRLSFVRKTNT